MMDVLEIKAKLKESADEYYAKDTSRDGRCFFLGYMKALEWVLNQIEKDDYEKVMDEFAKEVNDEVIEPHDKAKGR
jgi:hypothetical protein